jgi:hypothetical protein
MDITWTRGESGSSERAPTYRLPALVLAGVCVLGLSGCSSIPVDSNGRWVGGKKAMAAWAEAQVPSTWHRGDQSTTYTDIIDDYDKDTHKDTTNFTATYQGVSEAEFARFGAETLRIHQKLECEPYDPEASPDEKPSVKSCYLSMYQGQRPLPREFDLFSVWTEYPDGTTSTTLYLTDDPR